MDERFGDVVKEGGCGWWVEGSWSSADDHRPPTPDPPPPTYDMSDSVVQALEDQVGCYRRLAKLAELQHVHVQQDQTQALLEVLQSRQSVLNQITALERVVAPIKRNWCGYAGSLGQDQKSHAEALIAETRRLLEEITQADQNDALVLQQRKLNLGRQINQAAAAKQVNRTYAAAAYGTRASRMDMHR